MLVLTITTTDFAPFSWTSILGFTGHETLIDMYIWNGKYNRYNFDQQYYSTRTLPFFSKRKNYSQVSYVSLKSIVKILHNSAWNHTIVILQPYCTSRALATRTSTEMGGHPVVDWWARRFFTFLASGHHGFGFYMTTWVPISSSVNWRSLSAFLKTTMSFLKCTA